MTWPAAETEDRPWHIRLLRLNGYESTRQVCVREVRLWGRMVLINEAGEVYCDDCWRFISTEELGSAENSHRVGVARRVGPMVLPMASDPPRRRRPPGPAEVEW